MTWRATIQPAPQAVRLMVDDLEGEVLRAWLPHRPQSPRALPLLLEGVALWREAPLVAAISVDPRAPAHPIGELFGADSVWPRETDLVRYVLIGPMRPPLGLWRPGCAERER